MVLIGRHPGTAPTDSQGDYLRQARRLRCALRDRPAQLHAALRRLAAGAPSAHRIRPAATTEPATSSSVAEIVFLGEVRGLLEGPVLRYSCRQKLLKRAAALGIGRFQANLLIAMAQHQAQSHTPLSHSSAGRATTWIYAVALFVIVQSAILMGLWTILH
jgi:hypothetical protein